MTFPERQIYIRSNGRVQFITFSPLTQAIFTGVGMLFLGWVAFTSVNVIFKDRIIAAKERHFEQMQASYEGRIADLQLSYDELNGALIAAEDRFKATADAFEAKQRVLTALIERKENLRNQLGIGSPTTRKTAVSAPSYNNGAGGVLDIVTPSMAASLAPPFATGANPIIGPITGMPPSAHVPELSRRFAALPAVIPEVTRPARMPFFSGAVERLGSLFGRKVASSTVDNPTFHEMAEEQARIAALDGVQSSLLSGAKTDVESETTRLKRALQAAGINPKSILPRVTRDGAKEGGPLLPVGPGQIATDDQVFNTGVIDTMTSLTELSSVVKALTAVPLIEPVANAELSSGFGGRNDPFTEELAFHSGIDLSGEKGSDVHVTAPGVVVFAGPRGAYGNTVEVDHGYGIRTRYGHLSKIVVAAGTKLDKGAVVGKLGSTGRSTGPHVHYEVWYDDAVRDPGKFIKAGRNVRQE